MIEQSADGSAWAAALAEPFPPDAIGWKPQSVKGNRALAIACGGFVNG